MKTIFRKFVMLMMALVVIACGGASEGGMGATEEVLESSNGTSSELISVGIPDVGAEMLWMDGSTLVFVPEGEFGMGEEGGLDNPLHTVRLSPYWIQNAEVTNRQYDLCVKSGQCTPPLSAKSALAVTEVTQADVPVTGVNWVQASAYCAWIQGSLPTEAQWELAARGPESRVYPWGGVAPTCDLLNFENCIGFPSKVKQYANGRSYYGLFDTAGNVFEWVSDWYDSGYYLASPAVDPTGPESGTLRVFRSSNYYSFVIDVKLARRLYMEPEKFREDVGFRCVVVKPEIQVPYCQASAVGIAPSADGGASGNCAPPDFYQGSAFCANGNSYANIFVTSGVLSSTDKSSLCNYGGVSGGEELYTCGPGKENKELQICGECSTVPSASEVVCPAGYTANAQGNCDWGIAGMESVGGCPPGWTPGSDSKGLNSICAYKGPKQGEHCPIGSYYDPASATCVGNLPSGAFSCAAGFAYDAQAQCCVAAGGQYPGCGPNEFLNENGFCTPLVINQTSCEEITVSYINCEIPPTKVTNDGGDEGGNDGGGTNNCANITCNYPYTFDGVCSCIYNPKP